MEEDEEAGRCSGLWRRQQQWWWLEERRGRVHVLWAQRRRRRQQRRHFISRSERARARAWPARYEIKLGNPKRIHSLFQQLLLVQGVGQGVHGVLVVAPVGRHHVTVLAVPFVEI